MDLRTSGSPANGQGIAALALTVAVMRKLKDKGLVTEKEIEDILDIAAMEIGPVVGVAVVDATKLLAQLRN
jgi:hypothetical protein